LFRNLDLSVLRHSITLTTGTGPEYYVTQYRLVKSKGRLFTIGAFRKDVSSLKGPVYLGDLELLHLSSLRIKPTHRGGQSQKLRN